MKVFSRLNIVIVAIFVAFAGCSTKTTGNKIIASKSEFELVDSIIVGKTTKKQIYAMYGEPNKNFGKVSVANVEREHQLKQGQGGSLVNTFRSLQDGNLNEADDESYKITNPNTTNLIMYSYTIRKSNSVKRYIPFAGNFMSVDTDLDMKALYIGFDDNNIVTERWYSRTQRSGANTNTYF